MIKVKRLIDKSTIEYYRSNKYDPTENIEKGSVISFMKYGVNIGFPGRPGLLKPRPTQLFNVVEMENNIITVFPEIEHEGVYANVDTEINKECQIVIDWYDTLHFKYLRDNPDFDFVGMRFSQKEENIKKLGEYVEMIGDQVDALFAKKML